MSSHPQPAWLSPEQYLAAERRGEGRHEYLAGEIHAMTGASRKHGLIVTNLARILSGELLDAPCEVYVSDMRVRVSPTNSYVYPDVVAVCTEPRFEDEHVDTLINPTVIVEVLSPSTEDYDHGKKWMLYQQISSLRDYLLVAQDRVQVEQYTRQDDGAWLYRVTTDPAAVLELPSIRCLVEIRGVYAKAL